MDLSLSSSDCCVRDQSKHAALTRIPASPSLIFVPDGSEDQNNSAVGSRSPENERFGDPFPERFADSPWLRRGQIGYSASRT